MIDLEVPRQRVGPCVGGPYAGMHLSHTQAKWYLMRVMNGAIDLAPDPQASGYLGQYRFDDGTKIWLWYAFGA